MRFTLAAAALAASILTTGWAQAETMRFQSDLSAMNEVPPTGTMGTGHLSATYDSTTKVMDYTVDYSGLTGAATMAHFHGPAEKGHNADVVIPVTGPLESPIKGKATLTEAQAKSFTDGMMYFNIHTAAHKPGEIRGQVEKAP